MVEKIDRDFLFDDDDFLDPNTMFGVEKEADNIDVAVDLDDAVDENVMEEYTVRIFGLDNSGKSTLMMNLINPSEENVAEPTEDFAVDDYIYKNCKISLWDISGKNDYRDCWKNYFSNTDGYIYVVDVSSTDRIEESRNALNKLILSDKDNVSIPLLVYGNKSDKLKQKFTSEDLSKLLELKPTENIHFQICSASKLSGLKEGFEWLYSKIKISG